MDDFEKMLAKQLKTKSVVAPTDVKNANGSEKSKPKKESKPKKKSAQEKTKPEYPNGHPKSRIKKDGTPKKSTGKKKTVILPEKILPAHVVQAGKTPGRETKLSAKERESIRQQLVQYYGASKVDKFMLGAANVGELSEKLCNMRDKMEKDIRISEENQEQYFETIDKEYSKIGRPNAPFTWREFDYLCSIACPIEEIAGFFDLHPDTLRKKVRAEYDLTFNEYYERRSQGIKIAVRRAQIHSAIQGSDTMLKFLGINLLGQKVKIDFTGTVEVNTFADLVKNLDNKARGVTNGQDTEIPNDDKTSSE